MSEKGKEHFKGRIINCVMLQVFLEVRFPGIKMSPVFNEVLSSEELITFDAYETLVFGELREISKKLESKLDDELTEETLKDLRRLETSQQIINHFFLDLQRRIRRKMTISQRIKFLWENIKIIFSNKGGKGNALACR